MAPQCLPYSYQINSLELCVSGHYFYHPSLTEIVAERSESCFYCKGNKKYFLCKLKYVSLAYTSLCIWVWTFQSFLSPFSFGFISTLPDLRLVSCVFFLMSLNFLVVIHPCNSDIWKVKSCTLPFYIHFLAFGNEGPQNNYWSTIRINVPYVQKTSPERPP